MSNSIGQFVCFASAALLFVWATGVIDSRALWGALSLLDVAGFVAALLLGDREGSVAAGAAAAVSLSMWWKNRRKGGWKKAVRELGAKSKGRVEALARNMTRSPIPSPAGGGQ